MKNKLSDKDKKDWENFLNSKHKIHVKDQKDQAITNRQIIKTIDLHGYTLGEANKKIFQIIEECYKIGIYKINVITGKGLRSKKINDPYVSKNLSILKNSVPEYIKSNSELMRKIKNIKEAKVEDGGSGAFDIFLKKFKE